MCHRVFMYDGRDKTTNLQKIVQLNIYVLNNVEVGCKMKSIATK